ncbi:MAG: SDR family NAD(P)-dependent oxidoreductase [Theionarchaea archaeon]|nr:SDR family NAD(P)-dependent oxidoreductase [Theionarchaea archaeon]
MDLVNRVVLITGSSSGIGKETALLFAQKGCNVIITYNREKESGIAAYEECRKYGDALLVHLDVRDNSTIERAVETVIKKWDRIDILVNNAGVVVGNLFINQSREDIENQINIDLLGLMKVTRAFLPFFYEQGEGIIINIGSTAGKNVLPGVSVYGAAKAGLAAFTAALSQELPGGIRIYTVYPGTTATRMTGYGGKAPERVAEIIVETAEETLDKKSGDKIYVEKFLSERLKPSYYNVFFPFEDGFILFNTRRGSLFFVDSRVKKALENDVSSLDRRFLEPFKDTGVLIEEIDEKESIAFQYISSRFDTTATDVHIIPTYQCNLSCVYCSEKTGKSMDEKGARCTVEFVKAQAVKNRSTTLRVELFGGEPLLNVPVTLLIARELNTWCEENGKEFFLSMLTNGTLLSPEIIEELALYNCQFVTVLEGPQEIHDQRRIYKNGKGTFGDIIRGLHHLLDNNIKAQIRIRVDETNRDHLCALFAFLKDSNLHRVRTSLTLVGATPRFCGWNTYCVPDEKVSLIDFNIIAAAETMNLNIVQEKDLSLRGLCSAQRASYFAVDPFLRLYKCSLLPPAEKYSVGVVAGEDPLLNQMNTDFLSRNPLEIETCTTCTLLPVCGGGCAAQSLRTFGTTHNKVCNRPALLKVLKSNLSKTVKHS